MHDPVKRIVHMLTRKCHVCQKASAVADCAEKMLIDIESNDLVVDVADGSYMMGTPAVNEYNIRMLLGPRTFFARLGAINRTHLDAAIALLDTFTIVAPTSKLNDLGAELHARLHWTALSPIVRNVYPKGSAYHAVYNRTRGMLQRMNPLDIELYTRVTSAFSS